jgi:hypothetical protein
MELVKIKVTRQGVSFDLFGNEKHITTLAPTMEPVTIEAKCQEIKSLKEELKIAETHYANFTSDIYEEYESELYTDKLKIEEYILYFHNIPYWDDYIALIQQRELLYNIPPKEFFRLLRDICRMAPPVKYHHELYEKAKKIEDELASVKCKMEEEINNERDHLNNIMFEFPEQLYCVRSRTVNYHKSLIGTFYEIQRIKAAIYKLSEGLEEIRDMINECLNDL